MYQLLDFFFFFDEPTFRSSILKPSPLYIKLLIAFNNCGEFCHIKSTLCEEENADFVLALSRKSDVEVCHKPQKFVYIFFFFF